MTVRKASFCKRLIAFLFDSLLISIFSGLIALIFRLSDAPEYWLSFFLFYIYNIFMDKYHQATLGKMILKLKVISIDGRQPNLLHCFYRNFGKLISAIPLFYGFMRILAPHQRQTIHDELGKCLVIDNAAGK